MADQADMPAPAPAAPAAPTAAYGMTVVVDSAGQVLVRLHDESMKVYAQATVPATAVPDLVDQVSLCASASAALCATNSPLVH